MATETYAPLDDAGVIQALDKRDMMRLINELPEQCETALGIARSFVVDPEDSKPASVVIAGVGDAGLAADMAAAVLSGEADVPVVSSHGGRLPKHVGAETLVLIADYTGKSASDIRVLREAKHRGARVICVTTSGKLLEAASTEEIRVVKIPAGQPGRTAIGYLFIPLMAIIEKYGIAQGQTEQISQAVKLMKNVREMLRWQNPTARNAAKQTAEALFGKTIAIYGAPGYRAVVAERWKRQIAASGKALATAGVFPDVASGEISGWESLPESAGKPIDKALVILRDRLDLSATSGRELVKLIDATAEVLEAYKPIQVEVRGASIIEKLFYGIYFGDYVSCYLALLAGVDPSANEYVKLVEEKLVEPEPQPETEPDGTSEAGGV